MGISRNDPPRYYIYYLIMWLLKFWCLCSKELTGKISAGPRNMTYTQETGQADTKTQHTVRRMSLDRMKSLLYVSLLLSQARNTFIKWRFIHRLSLVQGWHCWECPGQLSLGVLWSPRWLKYCRLSLWLLARGTSWLLDCQCHSLFPVMTRVWICAHVGTSEP